MHMSRIPLFPICFPVKMSAGDGKDDYKLYPHPCMWPCSSSHAEVASSPIPWVWEDPNIWKTWCWQGFQTYSALGLLLLEHHYPVKKPGLAWWRMTGHLRMWRTEAPQLSVNQPRKICPLTRTHEWAPEEISLIHIKIVPLDSTPNCWSPELWATSMVVVLNLYILEWSVAPGKLGYSE